MKTDDLSISEFVGKLIKMVDDEGEMDRLMRIREWFLNWQFAKDRHYGTFNSQGVYQTLPDNEMEDLRYTSDFRFAVEIKATQWTQSSPELSLNPGSDANQAKSVTRHAEKELEPYREKFWTDVFKQSMAKFAMLSTSYFINTRPKVSPDSKVKVPNWKQKQVSSPKTVYGEGNDTAELPGYDAEVPVPSGTQSMPEVECEVELVDPTEIKVDPKTRAASIKGMDWMRRERYLRDYEAESLHPKWEKIASDTTEYSSAQRSDALEYKKGLEQAAWIAAGDRAKESGRVLQRQYWFDKKVYQNRGPEKSDGEYAGVKFKAGEKLIDRYPDGWYIETFNGKGVALFNEDKNTRWVGGVDTVDPTSPYGRGYTGLRNLQEMKDEGVSLGFAYLMRAVLGTTFYDPMMVESSDYADNRVGGAIPLKPGAQIEGRTIDKAAYNLPYQSLNAGFIQEFLAVVDEAMPKAADGAYDVAGGGEGEGAGQKTLGGQTQQLQTSSGMSGPALQLRTQAEIECFYQYLELIQEYGSDAHYQSVAGSWGDADAEAFRNCRDAQGKSLIREMVKITPVQFSEIPRSQMERRQDVAIAIQSGVANPQLPMLPGVRKYGLEQLRIPIEDDPDAQSKSVAESLLEKMKQAARYAQKMSKQMGIQPDPAAVAQGIASVAPFLKQRDDTSLPIFKDVFVEFLRSAVDGDGGIESDPALQQAILLKLDEIEQMDVMLAADMTSKQTLAQAPAALAQQALEQQGQEGEDPNAQAEADKGIVEHQAEIESEKTKEAALAEANSHHMQTEEADKQRAHESRESQAAREEAAKDRAHQLAMLKAKPKSTATAR